MLSYQHGYRAAGFAEVHKHAARYQPRVIAEN